jgi:uncharacterized membrane protein
MVWIATVHGRHQPGTEMRHAWFPPAPAHGFLPSDWRPSGVCRAAVLLPVVRHRRAPGAAGAPESVLNGGGMEEVFKEVASLVALAVEAVVVVVIAYGTVEAVVRTAASVAAGAEPHQRRREIWLRYAVWILLALEFALAADIIRTAVAPTWNDIGKLGAIAAIRTALNFFLGRDISEFREVAKPESRGGDV